MSTILSPSLRRMAETASGDTCTVACSTGDVPDANDGDAADAAAIRIAVVMIMAIPLRIHE